MLHLLRMLDWLVAFGQLLLHCTESIDAVDRQANVGSQPKTHECGRYKHVCHLELFYLNIAVPGNNYDGADDEPESNHDGNGERDPFEADHA